MNENTIITVFNHDTEQTFTLTLAEFIEWFNINDDIYSIKLTQEVTL